MWEKSACLAEVSITKQILQKFPNSWGNWVYTDSVYQALFLSSHTRAWERGYPFCCYWFAVVQVQRSKLAVMCSHSPVGVLEITLIYWLALTVNADHLVLFDPGRKHFNRGPTFKLVATMNWPLPDNHLLSLFPLSKDATFVQLRPQSVGLKCWLYNPG